MAQWIGWQTGDGRKAEVAVEIVTQIADADGEQVVTGREVRVTAYVDSKQVGSGEPIPIKHPVVVAMIGKLGLTAEHAGQVRAAIKATEEEIGVTDNSAEIAEYEASAERMRRAMSGSY